MFHGRVLGLPFEHVPKFSERCVGCHGEGASHSIRSVDKLGGWLAWITMWPVAKHVVRAPACRRCAWISRLREVLFWIGLVAVALVVIFWVWPPLKPFVPRALHFPAQIGIAIFGLFLLVMVDLAFPRPFRISVEKNGIDYHFADLAAFVTFVILNNEARWKAMGGCSDYKPPE